MSGLFSPAEGGAMSFREHLRELRSRLTRIVLALVIGFFVCWEYRLPLFEFLSRPIADALADNGIYQFRALQLTESVVVYLKTALLADLFFLSPYIFYELWGFISPGLYAKEKRFVLPLTGFSVFFFVVGAAFAYLVLLPFITDWLVALTLEGGHVDVLITIANTYSFAFTFLLMFGLVFELPLVIFFLALWGMTNGKGLLKFWRYFVVISFVVSGILTPPDPLSQIFMAVPLNGLYGLGVLIAFAVSRARETDAENAGGRALRFMALALLGLIAAVAGGLVLLRGLPQKSLSDLSPEDTTLAVGFNPRVLMGERAVSGLLKGSPRVAEGIASLEAAGADFDAMTDGLWVRTHGGHEGVFLRGEDAVALAAALSPPESRRAVALDEDTLLICDSAFCDAVEGGAVAPLDTDGDEARLLRRVSRGGPVWAYLPAQSTSRAALLGTSAREPLGAVGASASLTAPRQLIIDVPLDAKLRADGVGDRVTARIESARVVSLAAPETARDAELVAIVDALAAEIEAAGASAGPKLAELRARLARLGARRATSKADAFPPLVMLSEHLRGVSVRLDESRIHVTAEIDDGALGAFIDAVAHAKPAQDAPVDAQDDAPVDAPVERGD